ncbi:hypothetical protein H310_03528 [Aphanomyces invadans]|nr:hypothetical protein H310_03528 [Aphanomyces invadans]ETW05870.1 hypothetical protein H310_03528 [Aphanomyces invadans]|eukprot:XP_008865647.1 hypothetical protein H310_03528 [Aphanomyces invadans]
MDDTQRPSFCSFGTNKLSWTEGRRSSLCLDSLHLLDSMPRFQKALVSAKVKGTPQVCPDRPSFYFTNYTMHMTCPTTNVFWVVRQRFSQVYANRKAILAASSDKCSAEGRLLLRGLMRPLRVFPKRRLGVDCDAIVAERCEGFRNYIAALFHVREACYVSLETADASTTVVLRRTIKLMEQAVEMPELHKREELKWRDRLSRMHTHEACPDDDRTCSICLEDFEESAPAFTNIRLGCNHAFHLDCVSTWLTRHATCPLCRVNV